jgi:hypothetical protein
MSSRQIEADEEGTLDRLNALRAKQIDPKITARATDSCIQDALAVVP